VIFDVVPSVVTVNRLLFQSVRSSSCTFKTFLVCKFKIAPAEIQHSLLPWNPHLTSCFQLHANTGFEFLCKRVHTNLPDTLNCLIFRQTPTSAVQTRKSELPVALCVNKDGTLHFATKFVTAIIYCSPVYIGLRKNINAFEAAAAAAAAVATITSFGQFLPTCRKIF